MFAQPSGRCDRYFNGLLTVSSFQTNWETKRNIWWSLRRADGAPWAIGGLWSEWTDRDTGEVVPKFTAITVNCDDHPLLNRLHKPDPKLPDDEQDKRSLVHLKREDWQTWPFGTPEQAAALLLPAAEEMFDRSDAIKVVVPFPGNVSKLRKDLDLALDGWAEVIELRGTP